MQKVVGSSLIIRSQQPPGFPEGLRLYGLEPHLLEDAE